MNDDRFDTFLFFAIPISFIALFVLGIATGASVTEKDNITKGRDQGIVFCIEKAKQCRVEYDYLKLKENQK